MAERSCTLCGNEIAAARLRAVPHADMCVQCTEESGDVARLKRHDDWDMNMEHCESTLYYDNAYFNHSNEIRGQVGFTTVKEERMS